MEHSQDKILNYCLKNCVFDGWTTQLLENASIEAGLDKNYWKILFPKGVADVLNYFELKLNENLSDEFVKRGYSALKTNEKIRELIRLRLQLLNEYKPAIGTILQISALHCINGVKRLYSLSDKIWRLCGDSATDWNFYTKRALLSGVYISTLIFWLNDDSTDNEQSWQFLDRRLGEVGKFGKAISKLKQLVPTFS